MDGRRSVGKEFTQGVVHFVYFCLLLNQPLTVSLLLSAIVLIYESAATILLVEALSW